MSARERDYAVHLLGKREKSEVCMKERGGAEILSNRIALLAIHTYIPTYLHISLIPGCVEPVKRVDVS